MYTFAAVAQGYQAVLITFLLSRIRMLLFLLKMLEATTLNVLCLSPLLPVAVMVQQWDRKRHPMGPQGHQSYLLNLMQSMKLLQLKGIAIV
jgi:hypothetical protein